MNLAMKRGLYFLLAVELAVACGPEAMLNFQIGKGELAEAAAPLKRGILSSTVEDSAVPSSPAAPSSLQAQLGEGGG